MANKVEIEIDGKNQGAVKAINGVEKKVLDLDRVTSGLSGKLGGMGSLLSTAFSPLAIIGFGTAMGYAIKRQIDFADEIGKTAQKIGISTEALSTLKYAADLADVSFQELQTGIARLSRNMFEVSQGAGQTAKKAFDILGISVVDSTGRLKASDKILIDIAEKFSKMRDGTLKTATAMSIFGRAGAELIPFLNQGAEGINKLQEEARRLGIEIDERTAASAEKFNDSLTTLKSTAEGLAIQVLPPLLEILNDISTSIQGMNLGENIPKIIELYKKIAPGLNFGKGSMINDQEFQNKLLRQGYIDATTYKVALEGTLKPLQDSRSELEKIVNAQGIFNNTVLPVTNDKVNKLADQWENIGQKLRLDINTLGLDPQQEKLMRLIAQAEEYHAKYDRIPGALSTINDYLLTQLFTIYKLNEAKPLEQAAPIPGGFSMEQIKFLHDSQIALSAELTESELMNYALRTDAALQMYDNIGGALQNFAMLSGNTNKTMFGIYKAYAIAQAGIATYTSAVEAYKAMVGIPIVGPGLAIAAAAAATAFGLSNIARIASMQPGSSGGGGVGGSSLSPPSASSIRNENVTNNSRSIVVNVYGFVGMDKDAIARELAPALEKAWNDGVGNG
ncbi:MAG TPA: hypothetical protein DCX45_03590 [Acinetobacter junii]|nr:hypothetical protein [Acinetobacter junii]